MKWNVFVSRRIPEPGLDLLRQAGVAVEVNPHDRALTPGELHAAARGRNGLLTMVADAVSAALFDAAGPQCRVVANMAVGFNNIDVAEATRRGIAVTNTPGVLTDATADLTWALMMAVARRVGEGERLVRGGAWAGWGPLQLLGGDFAGRTLGIVGAGRIGAAMAKRAGGFDMRVIYFDREDTGGIRALAPQARRVDLETLLRESDFVCVHLPLTPETRHLFGEKQFRAMKRTAYFINTARGPIHDEAALVRALREGWIGGAGLDVYENEPRLADGLASCENAVLLPHLGSATVATRDKMSMMAATNLLAALRGERPPNLLNPEVWKG